MRASLPKKGLSYPQYSTHLPRPHQGMRNLLGGLYDLAEKSDSLVAGSVGEIIVGAETYQIPRFIYMGPTGGGDTIRVGILAAIHGDEPEGAEALVGFLQALERDPQVARGFHIYAYPICNPAGFVRRTRENAAGQDLAAEFWRNSQQPEVYYLEREIGVLRFHGVIALQTEKFNPGFGANTSSPILNQALAGPAVAAADRWLAGSAGKPQATVDCGAFINNDDDDDEAVDFLTTTHELNPPPFELHLGIPRQQSRAVQVQGTVSALQSILDSLRHLQSISQNI